MSEQDGNQLANKITVNDMVEAYKKAGSMISTAYAMLDEAKQILEAAYGKEHTYFETLPDHHSYFTGGVAAQVMAKIKQRCWKAIINRLEIRKLMSIAAIGELDKKLEDYKAMPEIELSVVLDTLQMLAGQSREFAKQAVLEVFELLRPASHSWAKPLKTNQRNGKFSVGKKVILSWKVEGSFRQGCPYRVMYQSEAQLIAIEKVFYQLDGAGIPEGYQGELVKAINDSPDGYGETKYFKFRACGNRNLHLEFKRLDLVNALNRIAGNPTQLRD